MNSITGNSAVEGLAGLPAGAMQETSFQKLQKRAFGGEDVAARPGAEDDE